MQSVSNFELHYEGNATKEHSMNISVIKDILSSMEKLINHTAKKMKVEEELNIDIKAFKEGSFGIDFSVLSEAHESAFYVLGAIGILGTSCVHGGVLEYLSWKRKRERFDVNELDDNLVELVDNETGEKKLTTKDVVKLASDGKITKQLNRILVEPFERLDLDKVYITNTDGLQLDLPKSDVLSLFNEVTEKELDNWTLEHEVTVEQVSLTPDGKWRIYLHGHKNTVTAILTDEVFKNEIAKGKITFKAKDRMHILLEKDVTVKGFRKKNTYTIHEVKKHWHIE